MGKYQVALISHEYPPFTIGGISINCFNLAKALSRKGVDTIVFAGRSRSMSISQANSHLRVVRLPYLDFPPRYFWFQLQNFKAISKMIDDTFVLHGVNPISSNFCLLLKRKLGIPYVATLHEHPLLGLKEFAVLSRKELSFGDFRINVASYPLNAFLMRMTLRNADHVIVPGYCTRNYMSKFENKGQMEKVSVVHNGVDFDEIEGVASNTKKTEGLSLISYGRLVSTKGISYLVKIIPRLSRDFPTLRAKIVGEGPMKHWLVSQISRLGLQNKVEVTGALPHASLIQEIINSDVAVLPTFHEVGPFISALEAMACRKTLVIFDFPFSQEFVHDMNNGLVARAFDTGDLCRKTTMALEDHNLREKLGKSAYEYTKSNHNWDILVNKYIAVYEETLRR